MIIRLKSEDDNLEILLNKLPFAGIKFFLLEGEYYLHSDKLDLINDKKESYEYGEQLILFINISLKIFFNYYSKIISDGYYFEG